MSNKQVLIYWTNLHQDVAGTTDTSIPVEETPNYDGTLRYIHEVNTARANIDEFKTLWEQEQ